MRGLRTLALLVVFLGLLGYVYFYESKQPDSSVEQKARAFAVESDTIEELTVRPAGGESATLKKSAEGWALVEPVAAKADENEVTGLTQGLASLEIQRVVDENATDFAQYGLAEPKVEVSFRAAGTSEPIRLLVGERTPTGGEVYARTAASNRVFLIASYLESTFSRTPFDLRDKTILTFERDAVTGLEVSRQAGAVSLTRADNAWRLARPVSASADSGTVEGVIGQLQSGRMTSLIATDGASLAEYGLDRPVLTATVTTTAGPRTIEVGKEASGDGVYARDTSRPLVFTISRTLVTELDKSPSDYRRKDVFDFRSFNAERVEITRDDKTLVFEKAADANDDASATWRRTLPTPGEIDGATLDTALSQLSALRVESFVDAAGGQTSATVAVTFDAGKKQEQVIFRRSGTDLYAVREGEPGAATVNAASFDSALTAFDALQ